jgi:uncharacterized repeat protein (TIGR03803 family)
MRPAPAVLSKEKGIVKKTGSTEVKLSIQGQFHHAKSVMMCACLMFLFCVVSAIPSHAQGYSNIFKFDGTDGWDPSGPLVQGANGNFYGTTAIGGSKNDGTVFEITPQGSLTTLYNFCMQTNCADGIVPIGLTLNTDGNFYGVTEGSAQSPSGIGCTMICGTIFQVTPSGELTTLYVFCQETNCDDGAQPQTAMIRATDGNFYGTTTYGGAGSRNSEICSFGCGVVYEITPGGVFTTIHSFCMASNCTDGAWPAGIIQATDGNIYGTTLMGGANNRGTIFKITPEGVFTTLYNFCSQTNCTDGSSPASLLQGTDGNFYGAAGDGAHYQGVIFKFTPTGTLTSVYNFCAQANCPDGAGPGDLIQGSDGALYGVTPGGETGGWGGIFRITTGGVFSSLHFFGTKTTATGTLLQSAQAFYGVAAGGPEYGLVYKLTPSTSTVVLTTSGSPSEIGQPVTFTATVTSKTSAVPVSGSVTFTDGTTVLGTVPLANGSASVTTSSLPAKTQTIHASYGGDLWHKATSKAVTQVVEPFATTTTVSSSPNPSTVGEAVVLTATVTSAAPGGATGTVTFKNGTTTLASAKLISGKATLTTKKLTAGTLTITANYNGDTESGKSSGTTTQTVN